jgi:hypothetical protein
MTRKLLSLLALASVGAMLVESAALAETCMIEITGPSGQWKFVHVYDAATGTVVLRQAIKAGDSRPVTVSGDRVRVDWKFPGYVDYVPGAVSQCKDGNRIKV